MERLTLFNLRQQPKDSEPATQTILDQIETENNVKKAYYEKLTLWRDGALQLFKFNHINYLGQLLHNLPTSFQHLDASQPWLAYWMVHSLRLLNFSLSGDVRRNLINFLKSTQHPDGGFGGGPYQFAHLATTYGAVNCLASLCRRDALDIINREGLVNWFSKLHQPDGSFLLHMGGEADVRGAYCAVAVANLTNILHTRPELFDSTAHWLASCQTYEGGFGGMPQLEAHGGYTFCAIAALCLLGRTDLIDIPRLLHWVAHRQMASEGGFQGRSNKLVDSCYSFWQAAVFPIVEALLAEAGDKALLPDDTLFNASAMQEYVLLCCQKVSHARPGLSVRTRITTMNSGENKQDTSSPTVDSSLILGSGGGLVDKPGKNADAYHTCYALSGVSVAQHSPRCLPVGMHSSFLRGQAVATQPADVVGAELGNELSDLHPVHNIVNDGLAFTTTYFQRLDQKDDPADAEKCATLAAEQCSQPIQRCPTVYSKVQEGSAMEVQEIGDATQGLGSCAHPNQRCTTP